MWAALHGKTITCGARVLPQICPPTGNMALHSIGFGQISGAASQLALLVTLLGYWLAVWVAIQIRHLRAVQRHKIREAAQPAEVVVGKGNGDEDSGALESV